jgi:hypothetical protein
MPPKAMSMAAAKAALGLTALLAVALLLIEALDAPWLGFVVIALLFGVLVAREVTLYGVHGFLLMTGALLVVIGVAFAIARVA